MNLLVISLPTPYQLLNLISKHKNHKYDNLEMCYLLQCWSTTVLSSYVTLHCSRMMVYIDHNSFRDCHNCGF